MPGFSSQILEGSWDVGVAASGSPNSSHVLCARCCMCLHGSALAPAPPLGSGPPMEPHAGVGGVRLPPHAPAVPAGWSSR